MKISRRIKQIVPRRTLNRQIQAMIAALNYIKILDRYLTSEQDSAMLTLRNGIGVNDE